ELYYQALFDAPVSRDTLDAFSMLNVFDGFEGEIVANRGAGRNYGVELTAEKFLTDGFYFLLSASLFRSEYRGSDGVWRNTRFDTRFANSLVAGKEWNWNRGRKNRSFGVNVKMTWTGGHRESPIDLTASIEQGKTVRDETRAFEERMPNYFRFDAGLRLKRNYEHLTTTLSIDVQNATNRENVFGRYFDERSGAIKYFYQSPLIPILSYRLEF
ncbi:MAG: TonB-dependent receptor, partial [Saprospiraceae bacterium]|nr:TonB-dependent receptor [Saprospiraceae bacterium]